MSLAPGLILAAGGIVRRKRQLLLVKRPKYADWSLPKGKLDRGETPLEAARREVREETGYEVEVEEYAGAVSYLVAGTPKVVLYWLMKPVGEPCAPQDPKEISETRWVRVDEAIRLLSYEAERDLVTQMAGRR
jgi:8-oxo-dGTP diphosphatase